MFPSVKDMLRKVNSLPTSGCAAVVQPLPYDGCDREQYVSSAPLPVSASLRSVDSVAQAPSHRLCLLLCLSIDHLVVDISPGRSGLDLSMETFTESCSGIVDSCGRSK